MSFNHDTKVPVSTPRLSHHRAYGESISAEVLRQCLREKSRFTGLAGGEIIYMNNAGDLESDMYIDRYCNYSDNQDGFLQVLSQELNTRDLASLPARVAGKVLEFDRNCTEESKWALVSAATIRAIRHQSLVDKYANHQTATTESDNTQQPTPPPNSSHPPSETEDVSEAGLSALVSKDHHNVDDVAALVDRFLGSEPTTIVCLAVAREMSKEGEICHPQYMAMSNNNDHRLDYHINAVFSRNEHNFNRSIYNRLDDAASAILSFNGRMTAGNNWVLVTPQLFDRISQHQKVRELIYTKGKIEGTFNGSSEPPTVSNRWARGGA